MAKKIQYTIDNSNLYYAAEIGDLDEVKQYITIGANPNYQEGSCSVLQVAVKHNHIQVVEYLLNHGADPNCKSIKTSMTALMLAESGEMVKLLAHYGADSKICDSSRNTALLYYVTYNCIEAAKAWVELKWAVNCKEKMIHNKLLAQKKFDMLTVITGFIFKGDTPIAKIAEFKALYEKNNICGKLA